MSSNPPDSSQQTQDPRPAAAHQGSSTLSIQQPGKQYSIVLSTTTLFLPSTIHPSLCRRATFSSHRIPEQRCHLLRSNQILHQRFLNRIEPSRRRRHPANYRYAQQDHLHSRRSTCRYGSRSFIESACSCLGCILN